MSDCAHEYIKRAVPASWLSPHRLVLLLSRPSARPALQLCVRRSSLGRAHLAWLARCLPG
jgi:hypothetical protein